MLVISTFLFPEKVGGRERFVPEICQAILKRGVGVTCLCYSGRLLPKLFFKAGVRYYSVPRLDPLPPIVSGLIMLPWMVLIGILLNLAEEFDVLYCHSFINPAICGFLVARLFSKHYVVVLHGPSEFEMMESNRVSKTVCREVLSHANRIIAVSHELARILEKISRRFELLTQVTVESGGIPDNLVRWIPDENFLQRIKTKYVGDADLVIVSVGRLVHEKGLDVLLESFQLLAEEFPRFRGVVVGPGPLMTSLKAQADQLNISENVVFTGAVSDDSLRHLIALADVCVIPSRREGTPLRLFEYMALGKPVICTSVGGLPDIITDSKCLVPPENPSALAKALAAQLTSSALRARIGANNKLQVQQHTWEMVAERTINIMSKVSERNGPN